ncbi:gamma-1-syntrophin-like [Mizuhopecten yessoensis]|uniref:gamma-1-syntrophin-like n=1 Tax=Mizuhopecten yessoensis TaxID=6573 RepID=UPI000B45B39E|nr:gamma-1-syntrophin-like [Mizuhopecten yessoensis]
MEEVKSGMVTLNDGKTRPQPIKLQLSSDTLTLLKEELVPVYQEENANELINKVREVVIQKHEKTGLGISLKGGAENRLPVLVSKLVPGQAAALTGGLYVGDAILKVNGEPCDRASHDEVISLLKSAGSEVTLVVKHFKPAAVFLNKDQQAGNNNNSPMEEDSSQFPRLERQWSVYVSIPLLFAYLTRYCPGTDKLRANAFEIVSVDGASTGVIHCDDSHSLADWIRAITNNISSLLTQMIKMSNRLLIPEEQECESNTFREYTSRECESNTFREYTSRECESNTFREYTSRECESNTFREYTSRECESNTFRDCDYRIQFGIFLCMLQMQTRDWVRCDTVFKLYECMFKVLKDPELLDDRQHSCTIQTGTGEKFYLSTDSRSDLLHLEKAWYRCNHNSIVKLKSRTFGCTWRGRLSGLTLDLEAGFSLYDSDTKSYKWVYKFSRLKGSSDDGKSKLKLHFSTETSGVEVREVECTNLQTLLFSIHAFLSAKLASVDPAFLTNY